MGIAPYRLCIYVKTPKVVTYGEAFRIEYVVENLSTVPFPGGLIVVELSWPSINPVVNQPTQIGPLQPTEKQEPNVMSQAPLLPGYTWFHVVLAGSNDQNNVIVVGENGGQVWPHQPAGEGREFRRPLHAVRARTPEEISKGRSLAITAWSLVILILFQIINWILEYIDVDKIRLIITSLFLIATSSIIAYLSYKKPKPDTSHLPDRNRLENCSEAKFELDHNVKFLTFWAVLIFTCITGMLTISSRFTSLWTSVYNILIIMYLGLLGVLLFSFSRSISIYRENYAITFNGKIGRIMRDYISDNPSILDKFSINWYVETIILSSSLVIFVLLLITSIGWL